MTPGRAAPAPALATRNIPTGSPTAPPTTTRTGASACRTASSSGCPTATTRSCIDSTLARRLADLRRVLVRAGPTDEVLISATPAIPRSPTTTCRASPSPPSWPRVSPRVPRATRTASCSSPARSASITWLARNEAGARPHPPRAGAGQCVGDSGVMHYKRSRRGDAEIDRAVEHVLAAAARRDPRLHPLRLRRAAVLLAGLRSAGRLPVAHAQRRVPRVPHVGRRPRLRAARGAGRLARAFWRSSRCSSATALT